MIEIVYDEMWMSITNPPPQLLKELFYIKKDIVQGKYGKKKSVRRKENLWEPIDLHDVPVPVVRVLAGLRKSIEERFTAEGVPFRSQDMRNPFPKPRLELMHGFRFKQRQLLTQALRQECNGLIGAPTRYGKTYLLANVLRAYWGVPSVVLVPGADLLDQLASELKELLIPEGRSITQIGGSSKARLTNPDITVCSMDSMHLLDVGMIKLVLVDEPHALPTTNRKEQFERFERTRRYGFSATLSGRFDGSDILVEGLIGHKLAVRTYREAVEEGAVCPIVVLMVHVPAPDLQGDRDDVINQALYQNPRILRAASRISDMCIPPDWQTLLFISHEKQADALHLHLPHAKVAMGKRLKKKERKALFADMKSNDVSRCISSVIYEQGVTFPDLRAIINLKGGGPYTSAIQKPGRLSMCREGKRAGLMIDFCFDIPDGSPIGIPGAGDYSGIHQLRRCDEQRRACYEAIGYQVVDVHSPQTVMEAIKTYVA